MSVQVLARLGDPASPDAAPVAAAPLERRASAPEADARVTVPLTTLARNATGTVAGVRLASADTAAGSSADDERMALRLMEIGFVQGASLRVIAFGQPGDDPIGVRVGGRGGVSTFALRRLEASCVWVWPDAKP
jgi:ferrous iron transport protein A